VTTRVLFVNDTARNGGPGRTLFTLLKRLDPAHIHRAVVVPRRGVVSELLEPVCEELFFEPRIVENPFAPWDREMERTDFEASARVKAVRTIGNIGLGASGIVRLARLARNYDVVFCNGTTANFFGGAIARLTGVPAVWHVFYTEVAKVLVPIHHRLAASRGVGAILCVSKPTMAQFAHCAEKVTHLHDAIDAEDWSPGKSDLVRTELGLTADAVVFGSQGRILRRKGFMELVRAAKAMSDPNAHFVILGDTPEDMPVDHLAECRALVRELGLDKTVHFVGYRADVRPWVEGFDVAVVPSIYPDPLPRSVMECMALAKPVVAFDVGGIGEMVSSGENGMLVSSPDVDALARACAKYANDPELRKRHGLAARDRILRDYDARAHARDVEEILVRVARSSG
jgi:glycosyltransferase involved in cell wall biosynthesis